MSSNNTPATLQQKKEGTISITNTLGKASDLRTEDIDAVISRNIPNGEYKTYYEVIYGECMPYFDFDHVFKTREELEAFAVQGEALIKNIFEEFFPNCNMFYSRSHGKMPKGFKFSMHVVMRGDGYFSNAPNIKKYYHAIINQQLVKNPINNITLKCDPAPYGNGRQLLRGIFAIKGAGDNRPLTPCEEEEEENYKYYYAQYIGDEERSEHDGEEGKEEKEIKESDFNPSNDDLFITTNEDMEIKEDNKQTAKKPQANKENDTEGDEIILTLEELTEIVNALKTDRFKDYNEWCHLLWIITRYCDKMNYEPDDTWELLEDFCKTCEGWQKGAVRKKMNEAHKITDHKQIKKMGTLLMWLKEDNKTIFNKYVKSKITQNKTTASEFDKMNPYVWIDFRQDHDGVLFSSRAELDNSIRTKINLVLARISEGKGIFLKKDAIDTISSISNLTDNNNFMVCYEGKEGKVQQTELLEYIKRMMPPPLKLYSKMGCFPLKESCPKGVYNVWYGIKAQEVKEVDEEKIKPFLYILKSLWANDDERVYKYLIAWFRMAICEPEKMIRVALFLYSKKEGTGKGRIVDFITDYVLGPAVCHIFTGMDQVLAEHNTNIAGKKIICINEMAATKKEFLSNFDKLKPIISDKYISENPKFQKITQVENITNVIMCTQHKNSIYIKRGNRRFTCLEVSDKKKEDEKFWIDLSNNYMNQEAGNHFYTWLLRQDKTQLPNPSIFCETKLRKEIIQISHDNTESFMDIITKNDGEDSDEFGQQAQELYDMIRFPNEKDGLYYIKCADMYNLYKVYCNECGETPKTLNAFKANSDIENVLTIKQIDGIKHYRVL
jgi:hypothetical protein